ncbi:hypothetical protein OUQ99_10625 [Streptomonospora nanhaiensis]|uniref:Uncharacterized protein n=1 Tax=Streptomonospora nanhaiensis TaxID=1323731 RepID=A0ABY6YTS3_9ACTN|nr:hypothetical protein [Streptomonospora nanhaiensis]WAE75494.1 hypothetical protein OUQ99_10625 [Streptomonospora nanhaiensis]
MSDVQIDPAEIRLGLGHRQAGSGGQDPGEMLTEVPLMDVVLQ